MKILYDHQIFSKQKHGGITKYFCEIIRNIPSEHQFKLALLFSDNVHLNENHDFFKKKFFELPRNTFKGKLFLINQLFNINQSYSRYSVSRNNYDLFHPTFYDSYFLKYLKKPYVITVHDLIEFKFKDTYNNNNNSSIRLQMETVIRKANRIIAISNNTKRDIIETFNINPDKIDVIYHGFNRQDLTKYENEFGRYILFVGSRALYKNFNFFVNAITPLLKKEKDIKLICVGIPFGEEELKNLERLKISHQVTAMNVSEEKLNQLYRNALVFVFPSLYEGFGMPILEAFANACPVCLSNTSCFPEIAGNAAVYFDPLDKESIFQAVSNIIYNSEFRSKIVDAATNRLLNFSWSKAAQETAASYKKAI